MKSDQFLPMVMPELPGCPVPMVMDAALETIEEFCKRTSCWVEMAEPITTRAGEALYQIEVSTGARVLDLQAASANGYPMTPRSMRDIALRTPGWSTATANAPAHYELTGIAEMRVWPKPAVDGTELVVIARLAPSSPLNDLPDAVMINYSRAIANGVKARLMIKQKTEWFNPQMAVAYGGLYEQAVAEASARTVSAGSTEDVLIPPIPFGGIRR